MTTSKISDYNLTADENKEINNIGIQGSDPVYNMDNALRELMAQLAAMNKGAAPLDDTFTLAKSLDRSVKVRLKVETVDAGEADNTVVLTVPDQSGLMVTDQNITNYTSDDAATLNGEAGSYYLDAGNLTGEISDDRLPDVISSSITGNAATSTDTTNHILRTDNPHSVTKAQIGLGNADNTSDADKPISTATQTALDAKLSLSGGTMTGDIDLGGNQIIGLTSGGPSIGNNSIIRVNDRVVTQNIDLWMNNQTCTADAGADTIDKGSDNGFTSGQIVQFETTGTLPTGLAAETDYYIRDLTATTMKLATTSGGVAIDITDAGTGTHTIYSPINGMSAGPVEVGDGVTIDIKSGSTWSIV